MRPKRLYLRVKSDKHKNYLFIDEIQDISGFEKALRSLNLKDNFDIYCTGSNAGMLWEILQHILRADI